MEENQTINLGNIANQVETVANVNAVNTVDVSNNANVQTQPSTAQVLQEQANNEAAAQVVHQSQTVSDVSASVSQVQTTIQPQAGQTVAQQTVQEVVQQATVESAPVQEVVSNSEDNSVITSIKLKSSIFKQMISNARKAAICEPRLPLTTAVQIQFTHNGLLVVSTDNVNVLTQKNTEMTFPYDLTIGISADLLDKLIAKVDTEEVELKFNEEQRVITIVSGGEFIFSEMNEPGSDEPIHIDDNHISNMNTQAKAFDVNGFKTLLSQASIFTGNANVFKQLSGIFCSDKVYSTDKNNMFGRPNIPELSTDSFCLSKDFVDLLVSLNFKEDATIRYAVNENNQIAAIAIEDENMVLCGPVDTYQGDYPIETVRQILAKNFDCTFNVDRNKLISILDKASLFVESSTDKDCAKFTLTPNALVIDTFNSKASQQLPITNSTVTDAFDFNLHIVTMKNALSNLKNDNIVMTVDKDNKSMVILRDEGTIEILSTMRLD